jgi:hypothetical protein
MIKTIWDAEDRINLDMILRTMEFKRQLRKKTPVGDGDDTDEEQDDDDEMPPMMTCPRCGGSGKVPDNSTKKQKRENRHANREWLYQFFDE